MRESLDNEGSVSYSYEPGPGNSWENLAKGPQAVRAKRPQMASPGLALNVINIQFWNWPVATKGRLRPWWHDPSFLNWLRSLLPHFGPTAVKIENSWPSSNKRSKSKQGEIKAWITFSRLAEGRKDLTLDIFCIPTYTLYMFTYVHNSQLKLNQNQKWVFKRSFQRGEALTANARPLLASLVTPAFCTLLLVT